MPDDSTPAPPTRLVRGVLYAAALLVFLAGMQLFVFPLRTDRYFAWTVRSPMTAVFLGASYWSAVGLELSAARARSWAHARIAIPAVLAFTTMTFVVTLVHIDLFHLDQDFSISTRMVTWAWIGVYAIVPVLMIVARFQQWRHPIDIPSPSGLPVAVRVIVVCLATLLLALGGALLIAPKWADGVWPWLLTPLTARAVGAWLIGLGTGAAHVRIIDDWQSIRPLGITAVTFGLLQVIALLRHGDELDWASPRAPAYVVVLAVLTGLGVWAVNEAPRQRED